MKTKETTRPITIFTPSFADVSSTNAQDLTVKEIVARLPPELFRVIMICEHDADADPRIRSRENTRLVPYYKHGNAAQLLLRCLTAGPDVYFYPRAGPLERALFALHKNLRLKTALVAHIVMVMNEVTGTGLIARSITEGDAVFANSDYVAETVRNKFGVPATTIYNGVDRRHFFCKDECRPSDGGAALTVLYAGSFQERKRVELVIQQAARWPTVKFRLVGRGETESACRALAEELHCENVEFLGHRAPTELGEEMRRADVFLFPSVLEGHPQVLGQAAACGLPAVAMNVYHPDYVVDGKTGFLAASDADLAQKLDLLLSQPNLRQSMAAAATRHSRKFDWDEIAQQWISVFQNVVAERRSA